MKRMKKKMAVDLHIHTTASDGSETPEQVVSRARGLGLEAIAITDHDTVDGIKPAVEKGRQLGVEVIPGVEISSDYEDTEVHVLGYFFNLSDQGFLSQLHLLRSARYDRAKKMVKKLNKIGIEITLSEVLKVAGEGTAPGRPHIARVLKKKRIVGSIEEAFELYLDKNGPAYVPRYKLTPQEVVHLIRSAGGVAVMAHPGVTGRDELIPVLIAGGLNGLEVYHPEHSLESERKYKETAQKYNLIATGGSDYHGPEYKLRPMGVAAVTYDVVIKLKEKVLWRGRL